MALVIIGDKATKEDVKTSREDFPDYIKITVDVVKEIVIIGGEYHADAEKILVDKFGSKRSDIWGGGYNINNKSFEVNAMPNLKPLTNDSLEILDPKIRDLFLKVVKAKLSNIQSLI
jgi:hypothetical protein